VHTSKILPSGVRSQVSKYYWEHEVLHTLVILNEVKDLVSSSNVLHSSRFFARACGPALRMATIICSE